jgi:hypothetical protein
MSFYLLVVLSLVLQFLLEIYKRFKFRSEIRYEQQLQQAVVSGVRNIYGGCLIVTGFLGCGGFFLLHLYLSNKTHDMEDSEESIPVGLVIMMLILSIMIVMPFIRNYKLR